MAQKNGFKLLLFVCLHWQNKMHPREWNRDVQFRGRVRVQLKQADGNLCLDKFTSRESCVKVMIVNILTHRTGSSQGLSCQSSQGECQQMELWQNITVLFVNAGKDVMFYVAEMIPKLKTRTQKSGGGDTSSQQGEGGKKSKKKKK